MKKFKVVIIGGGSGGISTAARLRRKLGAGAVAVIEPADYHYYQPMWTLVGANAYNLEDTRRPMQSVIPSGVEWLKSSAKAINAKASSVSLSNGEEVSYEALVVAVGIKLDWAQIKGLPESLGKNGICSIYEYEQANNARDMIQQFKGGDALFVMPPVPIKCAGAPQKIMYLAEEIFKENGVRNETKVHFMTFGKAMFGIPLFANALKGFADARGVIPHFMHKLVEVKPQEKKAVFAIYKEVAVDGCGPAPGQVMELHEEKRIEMSYDLLHVVPPQRAPDMIVESGITHTEGPQKGWLKLDIHTLQHLDYKNIFGIGDCTGLPNSKTGAAIRKQAPVLVENIMSFFSGAAVTAQYDGYSSCPVVTRKGRVMLAEFGYDSKLMPTFPLDPTKERYSMWILKYYVLPKVYWYGMLKGWM
jgi:sulfide:quinone oxidoreductase